MIRFAICDDEPVALDMLADGLTRAFAGQAIAIERFDSGTALRAALLDNRSFDVVLLDINMPDINGIYGEKMVSSLRAQFGDEETISILSAMRRPRRSACQGSSLNRL